MRWWEYQYATAAQLVARFNVDIRTIHRDVKALEQAGIPILKTMVKVVHT